jgi:CubicO group peptidase (beta-lactamase class C family)
VSLPDLSAAWAVADTWPVPFWSAAVVHPGGMEFRGDTERGQKIASVSKALVAWAILVAVEEGSVSLDDPVGQEGCTLRHLLCHAGGYPFEGRAPISRPGVRRHYSNTGIELAADHVAVATGIAFPDYLTEAVFVPLGMTSSRLEGSPAKDVHSCVDDLVAFLVELRDPRLISPGLRDEAVSPVFPALAGIVPGLGSYDPCPWGLGLEIRGMKSPHWTAARSSPDTFGHFGGIGTFLWRDPVADVGCVMLAERDFSKWGLVHWPPFNGAVLEACAP